MMKRMLHSLFASQWRLPRQTASLGVWRFLYVLMLAIGVGLYPFRVIAQTPGAAPGSDASEEVVKAAYLYRFPNYVEWPASSFTNPESPYVIGVSGDDHIADELNRISAGRLINNRPVAVKRIQGNELPSSLHLLFIGRSERIRLPQLAKQANGKAILIVTETDGALGQGSMINFRIADDRVRFEVALEPAEKAALKLSARLLALALSVTKGSLK